jgi:hypothetical protein
MHYIGWLYHTEGVVIMLMSYFGKGFFKGFRFFGENIASLVNAILLLLVYIIGVGLSLIAVKLKKKNLLIIGVNRRAKSYWIPATNKKEFMDGLYRQF